MGFPEKKEDAETCVSELIDEGSESLMKVLMNKGGSERQPDQNGTSTCSRIRISRYTMESCGWPGQTKINISKVRVPGRSSQH
eukprot:11199942-Lingulodinium_polyedra.AAC.1